MRNALAFSLILAACSADTSQERIDASVALEKEVCACTTSACAQAALDRSKAGFAKFDKTEVTSQETKDKIGASFDRALECHKALILQGR